MDYESFSKKPLSRKEVICHIEPSRKLSVWVESSPGIYKKNSNYYIINISQGGFSLTEKDSVVLVAGEFFFDYETYDIYVNSIDGLSPDKSDTIATFRMFYSTIPYDLPHDLDSGNIVHYEPLLKTNSPISFELDDEQTGIALDSKTSVTFINNGSHFDPIYDRFIWEEKTIKLWSWAPSILLSNKRAIFDGTIKNKSYTDSQVKFNCTDLVGKLHEPLPLSLFTTADGNLDDFDLSNPKRRIYGQVQQAKTVGIDKILNGYSLTGTISGAISTNQISGTGFLNELSPEDEIILTISDTEFKYTILSIESDIAATLGDEIEVAFTDESVLVLPITPYRGINRRFHIGEGPLFQKSTVVTESIGKARIVVLDATNLFADDVIRIGSELTSIRRVSGNTVVLNSSLPLLAPIGEAVIKPPVSKVIFKNDVPFDLIIDRDWDVINGTDVILELNNLSEFNSTTQNKFNFDGTFTNGSRSITTVEDINFKTDFKTRDWIKSSDITHAVWYEILEVKELELILRTPYAGATQTDTFFKKNVSYIGDSTLVMVDCLGIEDSDGNWVKTAADTVKSMVKDDAGLPIDESTFDLASEEIPYIVSKIEPENLGGSIRKMKNIIEDVNKSVLGSLHTNTNLDIVYSVMDARKPSATEKLEDDDVISWDVKSINNIVRKVNIKFRHFIDKFTGEATEKETSFTSELVDLVVGTKNERDGVAYLFNESDANIMAQRIAYYNSLSSSSVTVKSKLNLSLKSLNDKVWIDFDRLYGRFGSAINMKIGIINKITFNGRDTKVEFNDLGNLFNRSLNIAPNDAPNYSLADDNSKLYNGHIVSDDELLPDLSDEDSGFTQRLS